MAPYDFQSNCLAHFLSLDVTIPKRPSGHVHQKPWASMDTVRSDDNLEHSVQTLEPGFATCGSPPSRVRDPLKGCKVFSARVGLRLFLENFITDISSLHFIHSFQYNYTAIFCSSVVTLIVNKRRKPTWRVLKTVTFNCS